VLVFDIRVQEVGFWYCKVKVMLIPDGLWFSPKDSATLNQYFYLVKPNVAEK
jgi:hypothetical protein